jgi:uncharacterized membrane protein
VRLALSWNSHHHLLQAIENVDGRVMWSNSHLLFWLSLVPFVTGWMGENHFAIWPVALYGVVLLGAAIAYFILAGALVALHGAGSALAAALGPDIKGRISVLIYLAAIPIVFSAAWISCAPYVLVAVMWLVPDRRIEKVLAA